MIFVRHHGITFENMTVYATGHAYTHCTFTRCTLVFNGSLAGVFEDCTFTGCAWHLNLVVHDLEGATMIKNFLSNIEGTLAGAVVVPPPPYSGPLN